MSRERETIEKKVPRNDFLNDFNFETPCLNGTITEKKITHMEISWNTWLFTIRLEKEQKNTGATSILAILMWA